MNLPSYYGSRDAELVSFLEFGSIDLANQVKRTWSLMLHQDAYDAYMLARYTKDLLLYRDAWRAGLRTPTEFHELVQQSRHRDLPALLLKYAAIQVAEQRGFGAGRLALCESGSTLFGLIDEMLALDQVVDAGRLEAYLQGGRYVGNEISEFLNRAGAEFHPGVEFEFHLDPSAGEFCAREAHYDLFYATTISLQYSLHTAADLVGLCTAARLSVLNWAPFSPDVTRPTRLGTGKCGFDVSLPEFAAGVAATGMEVRYNLAQNKLLAPGQQSSVIGAQDHPLLIAGIAVGRSEELDAFEQRHAALCEHFRGAGVLHPDRLGCWRSIDELIGTESRRGVSSVG